MGTFESRLRICSDTSREETEGLYGTGTSVSRFNSASLSPCFGPTCAVNRDALTTPAFHALTSGILHYVRCTMCLCDVAALQQPFFPQQVLIASESSCVRKGTGARE